MGNLEQYRDALIAARLNGMRQLRDQNGEEVEFKSDAQMAAAISYVERLIAGKQPHTIRFHTSKGV